MSEINEKFIRNSTTAFLTVRQQIGAQNELLHDLLMTFKTSPAVLGFFKNGWSTLQENNNF